MATAPAPSTAPVVTLVVGGEHAFVHGTLASNLARHGLLVAHHWSWDLRTPPTALPTSVQFVYILTDMASHALTDRGQALARSANLPYANATRKWAESSARITKAGFPEIIKTPLPMGTSFPTKERRRFYAACFAENPWIANSEIEFLLRSYAAERNYVSGDSLDPTLAASLRKEFGLGNVQGRGLAYAESKGKINIQQYLAACATYNLPSNPEVLPVPVNPVLPPLMTLSPPATITTVAAVDVPVAVRAAYTAEEEARKASHSDKPISPTPAPAPVEVAKPVTNGSPSWMNDDLKVALQLVRAQFEVLGIESLTLTTSTLKFRRVVIEEGDVQI